MILRCRNAEGKCLICLHYTVIYFVCIHQVLSSKFIVQIFSFLSHGSSFMSLIIFMPASESI